MKHVEQIDWPNGLGYTPCTQEYYDLMEERDAIHMPGHGSMDDLEPEDYQRWNELDHRLMNMQLSGHVGKSVRY